MQSKRFLGAAIMAAIVLPVSVMACGSDGSSPLCCTEFKAGADLDVKIGGSAQSQIAVQSVADFAGVAQAGIDDLTGACRSMAQDLDAAQADIDAAEAKTDSTERMQAYCTLASTAIGTLKAKAGGTLAIKFDPPACSASLSAKASCNAKCDVTAPKCDFKAHPPECKGGKLEVSCSGSCTAKAGATLSCEGSCSAECSGSCQAEGGVKCQGKCDGTCTAEGSANGQAFDASGNCTGTCKGTCSVVQPGVTCSGSCKGTCKGECKAAANATVKCDGECSGNIEPVSCSGGEISGGCTPPDAKCDANCSASVQAKAQCTPPSLSVVFTGAADVSAAGKLEATFKANLGVILAFKAHLSTLTTLAGSFTANVGGVADIKAACIPVVLATIPKAVGQVTASASVTADLAGKAGAGG